MKVYGYLRASTDEQNAERAKTALIKFAESNNKNIDEFFSENVSGTKLNRPELLKLLDKANQGDVLLVEQIDRLTRLTSDDWKSLKRIIEDKKINIVSLDLPTSHTAMQLTSKSAVSEMLTVINAMLLDMLAITARKDYEDRRRRQAEGIEIAKADGKYQGRKQSEKTIKACMEALKLIQDTKNAVKPIGKFQACKYVKISRVTFDKYIKDNEIEL